MLVNVYDPGERYVVHESASVGRTAGNDIVLNDKKVSSAHARIVRDSTAWRLIDGGSRNGTRINGKRVSDPAGQLIVPGDWIAFGKVNYRVELHTAEGRVAPITTHLFGAPPPDGGRSEVEASLDTTEFGAISAEVAARPPMSSPSKPKGVQPIVASQVVSVPGAGAMHGANLPAHLRTVTPAAAASSGTSPGSRRVRVIKPRALDWGLSAAIVVAVYGAVAGLVFTIMGVPFWPVAADDDSGERAAQKQAREERISGMLAGVMKSRQAVTEESRTQDASLLAAESDRPVRARAFARIQTTVDGVGTQLDSADARFDGALTSCDRVMMHLADLAVRVEHLPPWRTDQGPTPRDPVQPPPVNPDPDPTPPNPDPDPDPDPTPPDPDPTPDPGPKPPDPGPKPPDPDPQPDPTPDPQFPALARPPKWPTTSSWPPGPAGMSVHRLGVFNTIVASRTRLIAAQAADGTFRIYLPPPTDSRGKLLAPDRLAGDTARAVLALMRSGLSDDHPAVNRALKAMDNLVDHAGRDMEDWYTEDLAACLLAMHATTERVMFKDNRPEVILQRRLATNLRAGLRKIATVLENRQSTDGGWPATASGSLADVISTRWALQALEAVSHDDVNADAAMCTRAAQWLEGVQQADGKEVRLPPLRSTLKDDGNVPPPVRMRGIALESSMPATPSTTAHGAIALASLLVMIGDGGATVSRRRALAIGLCDALAWLEGHRPDATDLESIEAMTTACRVAGVWALGDRHMPIWADTVLTEGQDAGAPQPWSLVSQDEALRLLVLARAFAPMTPLPVTVMRTK
ncbi:MAG: FHA domain-containing protein [Planctomycetota bacterium]